MTAPTALAAAACIGSSRTFDLAVEGNPAAIKHAKEICTACDLRAGCLEGALQRREPYGVWGGLSKRERDVLLAEIDRGGFLQEPTFTERHDRAAYNAGCRCPVCTEANRVYVASRPRVTERGAIAVPHKPNDRRRRCEGQVTWEAE